MSLRMRACTLLVAVAFAGCGSNAPGQTAASDTPVAGEPREGAARGEAGEPEEALAPPVKATLVADTSAIVPGEAFALAVRFEMAPSWHIYWKNPGETGLETDVAFALPAGFSAGSVRYPGPVRFESPGDIESYGYSGQVLLSAEVQAPRAIADKKVTLSAEASWVACREDRCVPGSAKPALVLPVAAKGAPAEPANGALFTAHRDRLPRPFSELAAALYAPKADVAGSTVADLAKVSGDGKTALTLHVQNAEAIDFFPARDTRLVTSEVSAGAAGQVLHLVFESTDPAAVRGVIQIRTSDGVRYFQLAAPSRNQ